MVSLHCELNIHQWYVQSQKLLLGKSYFAIGQKTKWPKTSAARRFTDDVRLQLVEPHSSDKRDKNVVANSDVSHSSKENIMFNNKS